MWLRSVYRAAVGQALRGRGRREGLRRRHKPHRGGKPGRTLVAFGHERRRLLVDAMDGAPCLDPVVGASAHQETSQAWTTLSARVQYSSIAGGARFALSHGRDRPAPDPACPREGVRTVEGFNVLRRISRAFLLSFGPVLAADCVNESKADGAGQKVDVIINGTTGGVSFTGTNAAGRLTGGFADVWLDVDGNGTGDVLLVDDTFIVANHSFKPNPAPGAPSVLSH